MMGMNNSYSSNSRLWSRRNLNLLWEIALSNFKLRNEGSILGVLWYLINPLLMLGVLYAVFSSSIGSSVPHYAIYVLIGVIEWNFFNAATTDAMASIETYSIMIRKVPFRKELLLAGVSLNIFLSHIIEWALLMILLALTIGLSGTATLVIIILLLELMLSISVSLLLGIALSYYRDVRNIWRNVMFISWFLTPIFYLKDAIPARFAFINTINPMTWIIGFSRSILIDKTIPAMTEFMAVFMAFALLLAISMMLFKRYSVNMAERI